MKLAALAMMLAACGGKVVFEEDGGQGGGSSSSSPSSASGPETFEPGPQPDPRGDVCKAACGGGVCDGCDVQQCIDEFGAGCDALLGAFLQCFADGLDLSTCTVFDPCEDEQAALLACPMNLCSDGCSLAEQDCSCLRNCDDRDIQMNCTLVADAQASCDCKVDGAVVSTCTETHLACDLDFGCCAGAFGF